MSLHGGGSFNHLHFTVPPFLKEIAKTDMLNYHTDYICDAVATAQVILK